MNLEELFNQNNIIELSFFNFRNAITAAYFANRDLEIRRVNKNFKKFFPILGNVSNAYFPDVLEQLGLPGRQIDEFVTGLNENGSILIPQIEIEIGGETRVYSLLSAQTHDDSFSYLNGVQGQFVDRTIEMQLRKEKEELLEQRMRDQGVIEEKSKQLEMLAKRLAKYLSPQIYESIFANTHSDLGTHQRKNLTVFFSDIARFTDLSDTLEPEKLARIINNYLSEMTTIAIECGGTIDKFIGDAVMVFFGDPNSDGETEDALKCVEMAVRMRQRVNELSKYWNRLGAPEGLNVRMGIATGYCTVGNFGSDQRLDYTALGSPVNLAARLQSMAPNNEILVSEPTMRLLDGDVEFLPFDEITPKGFSRPIKVYQVQDFHSEAHRNRRQRLSHQGQNIEVNVLNSADIRAVILELRQLQEEYESKLEGGSLLKNS